MKRCILIVIMCLPLITKAQQGIKFETGLNWQEVLAKAQVENKYIFVDVYAAWCVPCKKMDKEVYPLKNAGDFMNAHFISVKVQMDTSKKDDEFVKSWYKEAHNIQQNYKVAAFPTYLFFSPEGEIVHRYSGALPDSLFLKVAANAMDTDKQYYTLYNNYKAGKGNASRLGYLANISKLIGEDSLANALASDYLHIYLNSLNEKELYEKKYFEFASSFTSMLSSKDKLFKLVYKNGKRVDELMGQKDFSKNVVWSVITQEEINPRIWPGNKSISTTPDWNGIAKAVGKKYNSYYTDLVIVDAQLKWYQKKKDRPNQIKYTVKKIDRYCIDTAGIGWAIFNNVAYELFFKHCNNKDTLTKMIHWMEMVNKNHPDDQANMDTYANLLYKVGRKDEAIMWQERALKLEETSASKDKREPEPGYRETLEKMRRGEPTWGNREP